MRRQLKLIKWKLNDIVVELLNDCFSFPIMRLAFIIEGGFCVISHRHIGDSGRILGTSHSAHRNVGPAHGVLLGEIYGPVI
jgi:hypothetical protein